MRLERDVKDVFSRLTRFARVRLLRHSLPISLLILRKKKQRFCSLGFTPYKYIIQKQKIPLEKHARMCVCVCVVGGGAKAFSLDLVVAWFCAVLCHVASYNSPQGTSLTSL